MSVFKENPGEPTPWGVMARVALFLVSFVVVLTITFIIDAERSREARLKSGLDAPVTKIVTRRRSSSATFVQLYDDTGLSVQIRVIRPPDIGQQLRTLLVIGGHRTGSRAVELAGTPDCCAVVAIDYPLNVQLDSDSLDSILRAATPVRRAALNTVPAVSLVVSWLEQQVWVDTQRLELVGVSLGVPFATTAAALDERIDKLWVIHGASDNYAWIEHNVALRDVGPVLRPVYSRLIYWLLYASNFDTAMRIADIAPRPVVVIGAHADERTPPGQTEALFSAANEPKRIMWTEGNHIEPKRVEIVERLLEMLEVR